MLSSKLFVWVYREKHNICLSLIEFIKFSIAIKISVSIIFVFIFRINTLSELAKDCNWACLFWEFYKQGSIIWISSDKSHYFVVAAISNGDVAFRIIVELECSSHYNAWAFIFLGVVDLNCLLRLSKPSKDDDFYTVQCNWEKIWHSWKVF